MRCSKLQKFSLTSLPAEKSCIIFTPGCAAGCDRCSNAEFALPEHRTKTKQTITEEGIFDFLIQQKELIESVLVSGGEPTSMPNLVPFLTRIKKNGFAVTLNTNGSYPETLADLLAHQLVDYVAMSINTTPDQYTDDIRSCFKPNHILQSLELVKTHAPDYEFHTTLTPELHTKETFEVLARLIGNAKQWYLQTDTPKQTNDSSHTTPHVLSSKQLHVIAQTLKKIAPQVAVREQSSGGHTYNFYLTET